LNGKAPLGLWDFFDKSAFIKLNFKDVIWGKQDRPFEELMKEALSEIYMPACQTQCFSMATLKPILIASKNIIYRQSPQGPPKPVF
jgi:hypothetical protein